MSMTDDQRTRGCSQLPVCALNFQVLQLGLSTNILYNLLQFKPLRVKIGMVDMFALCPARELGFGARVVVRLF